MRAVVYDRFRSPLRVTELPAPVAPDDGVVVRVAATGLCRSDWHGWQGSDPDITVLPHVPGHEFAGTVHEVGRDVRGWHGGERVTTPFVCACGTCPACAEGQLQVCERQTQPGFTHAGSFAEYVVVRHADVNLVRLPDDVAFEAAAGLGCRVATAFRAVAQVGGVGAPGWTDGDWVAVHGAGGVGAAAVAVAVASGARVLAVDPSAAARALAVELGAVAVVDPGDRSPDEVAGLVREVTSGGARVSLDAYGSPRTCAASLLGLRRRGRHVQVGLLAPDERGGTTVPAHVIVSRELEFLGSHGLAAHAYPQLLALVGDGRLPVARMVRRRLALAEVPAALAAMDPPASPGLTVIDPWA